MRQAPALAALALVLAGAPAVVQAQTSDPAGQVIEQFDQALLATMKAGKSLGPEGRYRRLEPAMEKAFDLPAMTRVAVGPSWTTITPADQQALVKAFSRMSVATFAHNFDDYNGEKFSVGRVDTRLPDKLVHTTIATKGGSPTELNYRMRQSGGDWKVIDVMFGAVSQILAQRSDYSATLQSGGAKALIRKIDDQADKLLKP